MTNASKRESSEVNERVYSLLEQYDRSRNTDKIELFQKEIYLLKKSLKRKAKTSKLDEHSEYKFNKYHLSDMIEKHKQIDKSNYNENHFMLSLNQRFLKKFMSMETRNMSLLMFHGVGVGKTCAALQIAENFHKKYSDMNKTLILSSNLLRANFENEMFNVSLMNNSCLGDKYIRMVPMFSKLGKKVLNSKIKLNLQKYYEFKGYLEFANLIENFKNGNKSENYIEFIRTKFSNRVIIVDEVHNLRSVDDSQVKKIQSVLEDVVKHGINVRLVFLSATPMFNDPNEIIWIMNMLSYNEKKKFLIDPKESIFDKNETISSKNQKILKTFGKNYVSFMRGENPFTFPTRLFPIVNKNKNIFEQSDHPKFDVYGEEIEDTLKYTELVTSVMSDEMYDAYKKIDYKSENYEKEDAEKEDTDETKGTFNLQARVQLSNIMYPGSDDHVIVNRKGLLQTMDENISTNGSLSYSYKTNVVHIFNDEHLGTYSPKIKTVIDSVKNAEGIVLIYSKYIYSGLIPIALALEEIGLNRYKDTNLLSKDGMKQTNMGNYTILSGNTKLTHSSDKIIQTCRSFENKDGNLVKVILISEVATEGVDFKNVREIHIVEPWYNLSKIEQIIGRGVRNNSHVNLDKLKRNVTIFQHANLLPKKTNKESVDFRTYRIAEKKQLKISKVERILKESSIDCPLNKEVMYFEPKLLDTIQLITSQNNEIQFKEGDLPNSRMCDYTSCQIECDERLKEMDKTKDINHELMEYEINNTNLKVQNFLIKTKINAFKFEEIKTYFDKNENVDIRLLTISLNHLVQNKIIFHWNGNEGILIYRSNKYVFQLLSVDDKKITINTRNNSIKYKATRVPLNRLKVTKETIIDDKLKESNEEIKQNIYKQIENLKVTISRYVNNSSEVDEEVLWGMYIDKLSFVDFDIFLKYLTNEDPLLLSKPLIESMKNSMLFIFDESNNLEYHIDIQSTELKFVNVNGPPMVLNEKIELTNSITKYTEEFVQARGMLYGFVDFYKKDINPKFKMMDLSKILTNSNKDNKVSLFGAVCEQTAQIKKSTVLDNVQIIVNKINLTQSDQMNTNNSLRKSDLCLLYEYVLRLEGSHFVRPFFEKHIRKSLVDKKKTKTVNKTNKKEKEAKIKKPTQKEKKIKS